MKILEIKNISKSFGGFEVLKNISLTVERGERRIIIGPNGAGKTTFFNVISGILKPDEGDIVFCGKSIGKLAPYQRSRLGIARTFQRNTLFFNLSILDNLKLALQRGRSHYKPVELLEKVGLQDKANMSTKELSYGEQRQVEILLALAQSPKIILLDEPTAGMSPVETEMITKMIRSLPREITVIMIEHDMEVVFNLADKITVLHLGEVICEGSASKVKSNPKVKEIYLGKSSGEVRDYA
jgi:branched-chain amino acid transport system ATP-binding protein